MSTPSQPRQPPGVPVGGQFASGSRDRARVALGSDPDGAIHVDLATATSDEDYNATGSYSHPPIARSPEQVIKFWLTTKIPDHVLDQVADAYASRNERRRAVAEANPAHKGIRRSTREAHAALEQVADRQGYGQLPDWLLADVVRLGCLYRQSWQLTEGNDRRLREARFRLTAEGDEVTPAQVWKQYELAEIEGAFVDDRERKLEEKHDWHIWNLYQGINRVGNLVGPEGFERPPDYISYGGYTE